MRARLRVDRSARALVEAGLRHIRDEFDVPDGFPPAARAEVGPTDVSAHVDGRDLPLATLDPADSRDLDQAFAIEERTAGFRVRYAIADVAAAVPPGGALDTEAWERGVTLYLPDRRVPLHPVELSEGTASLLPGQDTPAVLWSIDVDRDGERRGTHVERAIVRSRAKLSYVAAQADLDAGAAAAQLRRLAQVGELLAAREVARGGVHLDLADQEVARDADGGYRLRFDRPLPVERHNAQLSLLTGMAAAALMLEGGTGLLRTLPDAAREDVAALRRTVAGLGVPWAEGQRYGDWVRSLDPADPRGMAAQRQALTAFRGAGYVAFTSAPADAPAHAALAAPYAHVTAPLRRLADRYAGQVAVDVAAGRSVAGWAVEALERLPSAMARTTQRAAAIDRRVRDLVEAAALAPRVGETFPALAVHHRGDATEVVIADPAVVATVDGVLDLGTHVRVRLVDADPVAGAVTFAQA